MHKNLRGTDFEGVNLIYVIKDGFLCLKCVNAIKTFGWSQWPCGLRRRSAVARLLRLWVRIPRGAWISVRCEWCVLSGRGLWNGLVTRPEESYRLWCIVLCVWSRNLVNEEALAHWGLLRQKKAKQVINLDVLKTENFNLPDWVNKVTWYIDFQLFIDTTNRK